MKIKKKQKVIAKENENENKQRKKKLNSFKNDFANGKRNVHMFCVVHCFNRQEFPCRRSNGIGNERESKKKTKLTKNMHIIGILLEMNVHRQRAFRKKSVIMSWFSYAK